jgi:hypothetical protein
MLTIHKHTMSLALLLSTTFGCGESGVGTAGGTIQFTASGEVLALGGYAFPPASADEPAFVDGWDVKFESLLVTLDYINLSENPDKAPSDQSLTENKVAQLAGPWAVDLHKGGPLLGKGGSDEQSLPVETLTALNLHADQPLDPTKRYAFGFDIVPANPAAKKLNLDAEGEQNYSTMAKNGWTVMYIGTATWKGTNCTSTNPAYDFSALPKVVKFRFGFRSPTSYVNCQNPDTAPAQPFAGEEYQRGVQAKLNAMTIAQATIHTDHPFWEGIEHDSPAHFDPFAAYAKKDATGNYVVTLEDLKGVNYTAFKDPAGKAIPWRSCLASYTPPNNSQTMGFDSQGIPYSATGSPTSVLRDYYDYLTYNQSTQGHLNADGICAVKRNYPSPK